VTVHHFEVDELYVMSNLVLLHDLRKITHGGVVASGRSEGRVIRTFTYFLIPDPEIPPDWKDATSTFKNYLPISHQAGLFALVTAGRPLTYWVNTVDLSASGFVWSGGDAVRGALSPQILLSDPHESPE
jgi:hypothetical protein